MAVFRLKKRSPMDREVGFNCHIGLLQGGDASSVEQYWLQNPQGTLKLLSTQFKVCWDLDNLDKRTIGKDFLAHRYERKIILTWRMFVNMSVKLLCAIFSLNNDYIFKTNICLENK